MKPNRKMNIIQLMNVDSYLVEKIIFFGVGFGVEPGGFSSHTAYNVTSPLKDTDSFGLNLPIIAVSTVFHPKKV